MMGKPRRFAAASAAIALALTPAPPFAQTSAVQVEQAVPAYENPPLGNIPIALIMDADGGAPFYEKDADRRFIPASLTKLMTMYTAFELLDAKRITLNQRMPVTRQIFKEWGGVGSTMFASAGETISVDTLLQGITTVSANDGCVILASGAAGSVEGWTALMNANAKKLGMVNSHFNTPNGWPDEGRTYTSARDLAILARALITEHPTLYRRYFSILSFTHNDITQKHHNPILEAVPGADGLKTGFTNEAGYGFVGSAVQGNRRLIMVLGGAETSRERKKVAREFIQWGFDEWDADYVFGHGQPVGKARVQGGASRHVPVAAAQGVKISVPRGQQAEANVIMRYEGPLMAPIRKGQPVGQLIVQRAGEEPASFDLVATEEVPAANGWQRLRNGFLGLFG
ncbi:D-alanyl-D-alanine carboxypeptidase family protein [Croceicoccus mobilis]|uniref:serine-type D-Ala-D-Ala carboxypeptidase n=1 Tax=Croceicoccus mobilis TaxID=1703339 RepID=A0A916Z4I0_9SPHN|nr:D-alanyl-D-alanine carboxypeptidase family protein [Croceicoccus mobilis]GGD75736.1 D-alanyl-D-alanine carboxypeptidase [Croceicoccus mobilis]